MLKLTTEEFIKRSNLIHNYQFDYSESIYLNSKTKINIICKKHGLFQQIPNSHLSGKGCIKCGGHDKLTINEFIERANVIHGYNYGYDKVIYKNIKTKVIIICKQHGDFKQTPDNHLNGDYRISSGNGCPKCFGKIKLNTNEFISKSNLIHDNRYEYDKTIYISNKEKVLIFCNKHGYFNQYANNHLSGNGCPRCNNSKGELKIESILKANKIEYITQFVFKELV